MNLYDFFLPPNIFLNGDLPLLSFASAVDFVFDCCCVDGLRFFAERFWLGVKSRPALPGLEGEAGVAFVFIFRGEAGVTVVFVFFLLIPNIPFFGDLSLLSETFLSVTSNPSWMIAPGTGRRGPTYLKNVSSTPLFLGVLDMIDATSSIVACAELFPFIAAS